MHQNCLNENSSWTVSKQDTSKLGFKGLQFREINIYEAAADLALKNI